jgi:putative Holliday junction resolvase
MARILAIDYGSKRTGLAVTDPDQRIASALTTVATHTLIEFLKNYLQKEMVECLVVGEPKQMNNTHSLLNKDIEVFVRKVNNLFPDLPVVRYDERFTSRIAFQSMIDSGMKKKARKDKKTVDMISATIILQGYLESIQVNRQKS